MAFTDAQKTKIRLWIGYADTHRDIHTFLESAMDVVGGRPTAQAEVETLLARLDTIDLAIFASAEVAASAGELKRADEVEWYASSESSSSGGGGDAAGIGRIYINRLATILDIAVGSDAFGVGGRSGTFILG